MIDKIFINTTGVSEVIKKEDAQRAWETSKYLEMPTGELLPRIC